MTLHVCDTWSFTLALRPLPDKQQAIVDMLYAAAEGARGYVATADLVHALWGADADGGPLYADRLISLYVYKLRRRGFKIIGRHGHGYALVVPGAEASHIVARGVPRKFTSTGARAGPTAGRDPRS